MKNEDRRFAPPRRATLRDGRGITIRLIEASDLPRMTAFYRDVPVKDGIYYRASPASLVESAPRWVPQAADNPCMVCLVLAADDGSIHGEAWYQWKAEKPATSTFGICIRPTMQGQGAGRLIMSRLLEIGDTYGPPRMSLTVQKENTRAWKLYTSLGFRPVYDQMRAARADCPPLPEFYMERAMGTAPRQERTPLRIGWASADITPSQPAFIAGQFHGRLPEEPPEPLTVTALVLENGEGCAAFVSCDLGAVYADIDAAARARIAAAVPGLNAGAVIINGTHTHTAARGGGKGDYLPPGVRERLAPDILDPAVYGDQVAARISEAVAEAWRGRKPGAVAWGLDFAVVGRNRRWVDRDGKSTMYGNTAVPRFSHIEGYEDHSVNVLATYDPAGALTGVVVNVACPSQTIENDYRYSPDYWHQTRLALRRRFGGGLFVLPQCGTAGDQSPHLLYEKEAARRMERLRGQTPRDAIAARLARAVGDAVDTIGAEAVSDLPLRIAVVVVNLPLNRISAGDAAAAQREADACDAARDAEVQRLTGNPDLLKEPRWYLTLTRVTRQGVWLRGVVERYEQMKEKPGAAQTVVIRAVRLGDVAFAGNPFEYYLDYGIRIKARSPFLQAFLVQLRGSGSYVPSLRSVAGGGYGSIPASNPVGPEGGDILAEETIALLGRLHGGGKESA